MTHHLGMIFPRWLKQIQGQFIPRSWPLNWLQAVHGFGQQMSSHSEAMIFRARPMKHGPEGTDDQWPSGERPPELPHLWREYQCEMRCRIGRTIRRWQIMEDDERSWEIAIAVWPPTLGHCSKVSKEFSFGEKCSSSSTGKKSKMSRQDQHRSTSWRWEMLEISSKNSVTFRKSQVHGGFRLGPILGTCFHQGRSLSFHLFGSVYLAISYNYIFELWGDDRFRVIIFLQLLKLKQIHKLNFWAK